MHALYSGSLTGYNSLQDEHLAQYYSHPRRLRHLRRMGLITKDGDIVDEATLRLNNALKQQKKSTKDAVANSVVNKTIEIERQARIEMKRKLELLSKFEMAEKVKKQTRHPVGVDEGFIPCPYQQLLSTQHSQSNITQRALKLGIDESMMASFMHTTAQLRKIISLRAPPSPYITKSLSMPVVPHPPAKPKPPLLAQKRTIRKRPKTSTCVELSGASSQRYPMRSDARVTMCYVGQSVHLEGSIEHDTMDVTVLQQHCGGNTVCVFKGMVKPKAWFTFTSRRHKDCPFGISIYLDSMFDCRLSTCCEYKHQPGRMLGCRTSHFGLVKVEGGIPCYKCQGVADLVTPTSLSKTSLSKTKSTTEDVVRSSPPTVYKESDNEINVEDIVKKYKHQQPTDSSANESESSSTLHNTGGGGNKNETVVDVNEKHQQVSSDNGAALPGHQVVTSSKESSVEPSKRRSVVFSPELEINETTNRRSITTPQTIRDAKEILKKSNSGYSFSSVLTSESDKSDVDVLSSSSSSADVDMLESRVSQLESGLITESPVDQEPESKHNQSSPDSSNEGSASKVSNDQNSKSSSQSEAEGQSDEKLLDNQIDQQIENAPKQQSGDNDQRSTSQLLEQHQDSSHSLQHEESSKPSEGDQDESTNQLDKPTPLLSQDSQTVFTRIDHNGVDQTSDQDNDQSKQDTDKLVSQLNQIIDAPEHTNLPDQVDNQQDQNINLLEQNTQQPIQADQQVTQEDIDHGSDQTHGHRTDHNETAPSSSEQDHNAP